MNVNYVNEDILSMSHEELCKKVAELESLVYGICLCLYGHGILPDLKKDGVINEK